MVDGNHHRSEASDAAPFLPKSTDGDALRLNVARLRALIDHLQSGIMVEDENRNIVHVNQKFLDIFGIPVPPDRMVGMNCSEAAAQSKAMFSEPEAFVERITRLLADRQLAKNDEMTLVDGRYLERDYVPILLDDQFRGHYWHYRDVTERMQAQQEIRKLNQELQQRVKDLARANEELEQMARARAQLVSAVAHELGNAMAPVRTHLYIMRKRAEKASLRAAEAAGAGAGGVSPATGPGRDDGAASAGTDREAAAMEVMRRNVDRLSLLIEDLVDASRLHAGNLSVVVGELELNRLVEETLVSFSEQARDRGVHLELRCDPDLRLQADARRVIQVMFNLLSNALKFTPRDGRVLVTVARDHDQATVRVEDTGAGISQEGIAKLFQPFSQAHDPRKGAKGTGLGLFICRGIVEQHGGRIWCESDGPGKGTTFAFTLPLKGPPTDLPGAVAPGQAQAPSDVAGPAQGPGGGSPRQG